MGKIKRLQDHKKKEGAENMSEEQIVKLFKKIEKDLKTVPKNIDEFSKKHDKMVNIIKNLVQTVNITRSEMAQLNVMKDAIITGILICDGTNGIILTDQMLAAADKNYVVSYDKIKEDELQVSIVPMKK